jgi:plasmid maintenance system antidote protein VapI
MGKTHLTTSRLNTLLPAIFIINKMKAAGMSRSKLASATGYTTAHFSKILSDNSRVTPAFAYALSQVLDFPPIELLTIQTELDLKREIYIQMRSIDQSAKNVAEEFDKICLEVLRTYESEVS